MNNTNSDIKKFTNHKNDNFSNIFYNKKNVLITGATGFLGTHLLIDLLHFTKANIFCLIRGKNLHEIKHKLFSSLKKMKLLHPNLNINRIHCIQGDLNKPNVGLNKKDLEYITQNIDTILHCGAYVHHLHHYSTLRNINVLSTIELINIAKSNTLKELHYISTIGISNIDNNIYHPANKLTEIPYNDMGYVQSKWVCEKIIFSYIKCKYPFYIYRPGNITGHSDTGFCIPYFNHALLLLKGFIQSNIAPIWKIPIEMVPVNLVSQSIVKIMNNTHTIPNHNIFNISNTKTINWDTYINIVNKIQNINIKLINTNEWRTHILPNIKKNNAIYPFKEFYMGGNQISDTNIVQDHTTKKILETLNIYYPTNYTTLITTYLNFLTKIKFI